jgi:hypothetical protein
MPLMKWFNQRRNAIAVEDRRIAATATEEATWPSA